MKLQKYSARVVRFPRAIWIGAFALAVVVATLPTVSHGLLQQNANPHLPPELNRFPDSNQANDINSQQTQKKDFEAANTERKKQIADDSEKLLKLATDLKTEVDKTSKDTLSLNVIRKADAIEKLAHDVKEKMKLSVGPG
jgi:cytochrome c-type biogenesis protein CcmH/NrfG